MKNLEKNMVNPMENGRLLLDKIEEAKQAVKNSKTDHMRKLNELILKWLEDARDNPHRKPSPRTEWIKP
jgi:hypothetical protein